MKKQLISYLILPKGIRGIFFKSYVYFVPFLYSLSFSLNYREKFILFLLIFFLFEFVINQSRYQLNDLVDYEEDQKRKHHWQRPVSENSKHLILTVAISRFILGTIIAFFLNVRLGYLAVLFLTLQLFYDYFAKKRSPLLAVFTVSIAYPLRSLTILYGLEVELSQTVIFLLLSILLYATYMVFQWRKNESLFIFSNKLASKPHTEFFINPKVNFLISAILLIFILIFISLVISFVKLDTNNILIIYTTSLLLILVCLLSDKQLLKKIATQSHNIFIAFLFIILIFDRFLTALAISTITILIAFWYHKIYVEKFANNYFSKTHYDKT